MGEVTSFNRMGDTTFFAWCVTAPGIYGNNLYFIDLRAMLPFYKFNLGRDEFFDLIYSDLGRIMVSYYLRDKKGELVSFVESPLKVEFANSNVFSTCSSELEPIYTARGWDAYLGMKYLTYMNELVDYYVECRKQERATHHHLYDRYAGNGVRVHECIQEDIERIESEYSIEFLKGLHVIPQSPSYY